MKPNTIVVEATTNPLGPSRIFLKDGKLRGPNGEKVIATGMDGPVVIMPRESFDRMEAVWNWYTKAPVL